MNPSLHNSINSAGYYEQLVAALTIDLPKGWLLSDRTRLGSDANPYHPLIIYKGIGDFFADSITVGEQQNTFIEQISAIQFILLECTPFKLFCVEMQRLSDITE